MGALRPDVEEYIQATLTAMRAPLKAATTFTPAGRTVIHRDGERIIYGPRGEKIRVIENPLHGTQIEHGDRLHAVVRPHTVKIQGVSQ